MVILNFLNINDTGFIASFIGVLAGSFFSYKALDYTIKRDKKKDNEEIISKIDKKANTSYVEEKNEEIYRTIELKHKESICYTDGEIKKRAETETAYRDGLQKQISQINEQTNFIYHWVINQQKK